MKLFCTFAPLVFITACGGDSPLAPPPVTAPPPAPVVRTVTFTPDASTITGSALSIQTSNRGNEAGKVTIAIVVHNIPRSVHKVRGELRWDPALLEYDNWGQGDFLNQGGALVDWTISTATAGQVSLFLDRPSTLPPAGGSGEIIVLRLRPRTGVTSGTSRLQWDDPRLLDSEFRRYVPANIYTGTITIQ